MTHYVFCKTCKKRQKLESTQDEVLMKFIKYHNTHNVFVETAGKMGYDILAYSDQWIGKKPQLENIKPQEPISAVTDKLYIEIAALESKSRELELALFDLKASLSPSPEERKKMSEPYLDLLKEIVRNGGKIARNESIPLDTEQIKELETSAEERIKKLPKEVRGEISDVVEE